MSEIYWLNKESRNFLSKGYLIDGESAEDRLHQIADTAQKYLPEIKFYD